MTELQPVKYRPFIKVMGGSRRAMRVWIDTLVTAKTKTGGSNKSFGFGYGVQTHSYSELCGKRRKLFAFCAGKCFPKTDWVIAYKVKNLEGLRIKISITKDCEKCPKCNGPVFWSTKYKQTGLIQERVIAMLDRNALELEKSLNEYRKKRIENRKKHG